MIEMGQEYVVVWVPYKPSQRGTAKVTKIYEKAKLLYTKFNCHLSTVTSTI